MNESIDQPRDDDLLRMARDWRDAPGAVPDEVALERLRQARAEAVAALSDGLSDGVPDSGAEPGSPFRPASLPWRWGVAAGAAVALAITLQLQRGGASVEEDALEIAAVEQLMDDQALLEELEFIAWVAAEGFGEAG